MRLLVEIFLIIQLLSFQGAADDVLEDRIASFLLRSSPKQLQNDNLGNILSKEADVPNNNYLQSSCQLVQVAHLLRHVGCQPKAIASSACSGSCPSYVQTSTSKLWQHERFCSCCQQTGLQEATFTLDCPSLDPPYKKVKTYAPVDCLCRACTDLGKEDLRPQELVEILDSGVEGNTADKTVY